VSTKALSQVSLKDGISPLLFQQFPNQSLPPELVFEVISHSKKEDLFHASLVCRDLVSLIDDSYLWKQLFARDFPERLPTASVADLPNPWKELYRAPIVTRANIKKKEAQVTPLAGHAERVASMSCSGSLVLTGDETGMIIVRAKNVTGNFEDLQTIQPCKEGVFQTSPEQDYLVFQHENSLKVYRRAESGKFEEIQKSLNVDGTEIIQYKIGTSFLSVSTRQNSMIYRKGTDGLFQECKRLDGYHLALVSGDYLFAASGDQTVQMWKKDARGEFQEHQSYLNANPSSALPSWIFFENGHLILASIDGKIRIFKQEKNGLFSGPTNHDVAGENFMNLMSSFEAEGDYLFAGMHTGALVILKKMDSGAFQPQPDLEKAHDYQISALSINENYLVTGSIDGTVKIWEQEKTGTYSLLQTFADPELDEAVTNVSMKGSKLFISYLSGAVKIWDFLSKKK